MNIEHGKVIQDNSSKHSIEEQFLRTPAYSTKNISFQRSESLCFYKQQSNFGFNSAIILVEMVVNFIFTEIIF